MKHGEFALLVLLTSVITTCNREAPVPNVKSTSSQPPLAAATSATSGQAEHPASPAVPADQKAEVERLVAEGSAIMKRIIKNYPNTEPCIGDGSSFLMVGLPEDAWSNLAPRKRVALSYYVESRVPFARERPARYLITPEDAPIFSQFAAEVRRALCDTCWAIVTGPYSRDGGVSPDRALLNGDGCTRCWGQGPAARELRSQVLSSALPPITWRVGTPDGEPSCAGYVQPPWT